MWYNKQMDSSLGSLNLLHVDRQRTLKGVEKYEN